MKNLTIEEIKKLDTWSAAKLDQDVHVLWTTICAGREKIVVDGNDWVSNLMEMMKWRSSDITREIVERERLKRTGAEYTPEGDLPDPAGIDTVGDWLRAWSAGDDSITISQAE